MDVYLIRHARAEDRRAYARLGGDDSERPLTAEGERKMRSQLCGLKRLGDGFDAVAASPYRRAQQTARLIEEVMDRPFSTLDALRPGGEPRELLNWLSARPGASVALVGHEPDLGEFGSWLLTGRRDGFLRLRRGSVCCLRLPDAGRAGQARLRWLVSPGQLRMLGRTP